MLFAIELSNPSEYYYLEPGRCHSITDIVEAANTLIQERHNHTQNSIAVKVSRRQKIENKLANEGSALAFFSTELGHIFGNNYFEELLRGAGPQKPVLGYDIVRIHSLMIYTDLIQYNIVVDKSSNAALSLIKS